MISFYIEEVNGNWIHNYKRLYIKFHKEKTKNGHILLDTFIRLGMNIVDYLDFRLCRNRRFIKKITFTFIVWLYLFTEEGDLGEVVSLTKRGRHEVQWDFKARVRGEDDRVLIVALQGEVVGVGEGWDQLQGLWRRVVQQQRLLRPPGAGMVGHITHCSTCIYLGYRKVIFIWSVLFLLLPSVLNPGKVQYSSLVYIETILVLKFVLYHGSRLFHLQKN